VADTAIPF